MSRSRQIKKFGRQVEAFLAGGPGLCVSRAQFERAKRALDEYYPWARHLVRDLAKLAPRLQRYAGYRVWLREQRTVPEMDVARDLAKALAQAGDSALLRLRPSPADPPDVGATDPRGRAVAIEVTELVDEEAIRRNRSGQHVYRQWTMAEVLTKLEALIRTKDRKRFLGGPYHRVIVAIHTDEPAISWQECQVALESWSVAGLAQITEAYCVFSWDPATESCPVLKIRLGA